MNGMLRAHSVPVCQCSGTNSNLKCFPTRRSRKGRVMIIVMLATAMMIAMLIATAVAIHNEQMHEASAAKARAVRSFPLR